MRRSSLGALVGVVLLVVGGATLTWRRVGFGWTGWSSSTQFTPDSGGPGMIVLDGLNMLAVLSVLLGIALVAGAAGVEWARRRHPQDG